MANSNSVTWRYIVESSFGVPTNTTGYKEVMRTGGSFNGKTDTVTSKAVRSDRMTQGFYRTGKNSEGSIEVEMAYAQFDDLIEAALCGTWTAAVSYTGGAGVIDRVDTVGVITFTDSSNGFLTAGIVSGMWIRVAGFAGNYNHIYRVLVAAAGTLTLDGHINTTTGAFTSTIPAGGEAPAGAVTITNAGMLRNGVTGRSFTWEQAHTDLGGTVLAPTTAFQFHGMRLNDWSINISAKSLVTGTFTWLGGAFTAGASPVTVSVVAPNDNDAYNTTEDIVAMAEGTSALTEYVSSITLSSKNNLSMIDAVGNLTPPDITYGVMDISGELNVYLASTTLAGMITKYTGFTETSLLFAMRNLTAAATYSYYLVTIPAYKYSGGIPEAGALSGQAMCKFPFNAYKGPGSYQIQIDKIVVL